MDGTVTLTETTHGSVKRIYWSWLSNSSGNADKQTDNVYSGEIVGMTIDPGDGVRQPTANYDITITNDNNVDVFNSQATNLSNVVNQNVWPVGAASYFMRSAVVGKLTLNVTNAGSGKSGKVYLYIR